MKPVSHSQVLNYIPIFTLLIREHCKIFSRESPLNVDSKHKVTFTLWFKDRVSNVFLVNILFF